VIPPPRSSAPLISRYKTRHAARVHFVGVGGIGMSGIAEVLINLGYSVSGSDLKESDVTKRLVSLGARVEYGHRRENLRDAEVVVISSAVKKDNPEVASARERKIPVIARAEMLAELMRLKYAVAIAGSHGKTTTTSMLATVINAAGLDPTAVVGGKVNVLGSNAKLGKSELMVVEADESDGSFLHLHPSIAVVTNIDPEHLDHYGTLENLKQGFADFCNRVPFYGLNVLCLDSPNVQALVPLMEKRVVTYGSSHAADYRIEGIQLDQYETRFTAFRRDTPLGDFTVKMVGAHNAMNALAVIAVAEELDVPLDTVRAALADFGGVQRRFTVKGEHDGITVVDDYGRQRQTQPRAAVLKKPAPDGSSVLVLTPLQLVKRLCALVVKPKVHLTRFFGVFAPHSRWRPRVVPLPPPAPPEPQPALPPLARRPSRPRLDWAGLLRRTFLLDVLACPCGGRRRVLAVITSPDVARRMLRLAPLRFCNPVCLSYPSRWRSPLGDLRARVDRSRSFARFTDLTSRAPTASRTPR
jgi:UDP-N-acetylmuramate--L-alanine ligase